MENYAFLERIQRLKEKIAASPIDALPFNNLFDQYHALCLDLKLQSSAINSAPEDFLMALREELAIIEKKISVLEKTCKVILDQPNF